MVNLKNKVLDLLTSDNTIQIHREIDEAEEKIYREALEIINKTKPKTQTIRDLIELGFTNVPMVQNEKPNYNADKLANLIKHYRKAYPGIKFLTVNAFIDILSKYNLVAAPAVNYIKDIPLKNIEEIKNAQRLNVGRFDYLFNLKITKKNPAYPRLNWEEKKLLVNQGLFVFADTSDTSVRRRLAAEQHPIWQNSHTWNSDFFNVDSLVSSGLFIAAPKNHFNLKGLKGYKTQFFNVIKPKDPIAFRYIHGGVQILSKWGPEESIEEIN